ncbi:MAG TPA: bifunctional pyr operon transcriptional regulator/uracil phosphoribosyltransferase PyrR [Candidatus Dormibacteraeota bacterium]
MTAPTKERQVRATVMDAEAMRRSLQRIAHEIVERNKGVEDLVLVGIVRQGDVLAQRLATLLTKMERCQVPVGRLDITAHRDDLHLRRPDIERPPTELPDIDGKVVVLVDDVIWHGRTARAAIDALLEHGRPRAVQLAALVDRGHRELPIRPDYVGKNVPTAAGEMVRVCVAEHEGVDAAVILR